MIAHFEEPDKYPKINQFLTKFGQIPKAIIWASDDTDGNLVFYFKKIRRSQLYKIVLTLIFGWLVGNRASSKNLNFSSKRVKWSFSNEPKIFFSTRYPYSTRILISELFRYHQKQILKKFKKITRVFLNGIKKLDLYAFKNDLV